MILKVRFLFISESYPKKFIINSNREIFINRNDDIEKTKPAPLYKFFNKENFNLSTIDIPKAQPLHNRFVTQRKPFNPLDPRYQFPGATDTYNDEKYHEKFIRDQIYCRDIEGAFPVKKFMKKPYIPEDIKGAKPKINIRELKNVSNDMYKIENAKKKKFIRDTNPLNPVYELSYSPK